MTELLITAVIATLAVVISIVAAICCIAAWVELRAAQKSTHQVQFVPADSKWAAEEQAMNQMMDREIPDLAGVDYVNDRYEPIS